MRGSEEGGGEREGRRDLAGGRAAVEMQGRWHEVEGEADERAPGVGR
jgi:hypothetical protein